MNYCAKVSVDNEHAQDLHLRHISYDDYAQLVVDENADPHTVYVLSGEGYDDQFGNRIANVAAPELSGDAANKAYVDGEISNLSANLPKAGSSLFLTDDSLQLSGMQSDANIVKVTHDKYKWYINNYTQQELSNYIFVLSSDVEDVFGKRIANVADPI